MQTEHVTSCLNKLLKNWEIFVYQELSQGGEIFTIGDELNKYPYRFKPLYKINVRLK